MAHHAYFALGNKEETAAEARAFASNTLGLAGSNNPDVVMLTFGLFSVEDARKLITSASLSGVNGSKVIIASMTRIFHEAQNALLKVVEEPPAGVTIILCIPSEGVLITTLRSRLLPLPLQEGTARSRGNTVEPRVSAFLGSSTSEREKMLAKLVERSKSDKDDVKQEARREAIELLNGIAEAAYTSEISSSDAKERSERRMLLEDLSAFAPILYERSAPLKLIFEHLQLVIPKTLAIRAV